MIYVQLDFECKKFTTFGVIIVQLESQLEFVVDYDDYNYDITGTFDKFAEN